MSFSSATFAPLTASLICLGFGSGLPTNTKAADAPSSGGPKTPTLVQPRIIATGNRTVLLRSDGTIWRWGRAEGGRGERITTNDLAVPTQVGADRDWQQLDAEWFSNVALKADGTLWSWGENQYGQLGNGTTTSSPNPVAIGTDKDWATFAADRTHVVALKTDGSLWSWGWNGSGELGTGNTSKSLLPVRIGVDRNWKTVFAGVGFSLAQKEDGSLWAWGLNNVGQLGTGDFADKYVPTQVGTDKDWLAVCPGNDFVLALKSDHSLWAWGLNDSGQLGDGAAQPNDRNPANNRNAPARIGASADWQAVAGGYQLSLGIKQDGSLWSWGTGSLGSDKASFSNVPLRVGDRNGWLAVSVGEFHSVGVDSSGRIWAWGPNDFGQLGIGTKGTYLGDSRVAKSVPTLIPGFTVDGFKVKASFTNGRLKVSWSFDASGYALETASYVTGPWSVEQGTTVDVDSEYWVTLPFAQNHSFFRLRK